MSFVNFFNKKTMDKSDISDSSNDIDYINKNVNKYSDINDRKDRKYKRDKTEKRYKKDKTNKNDYKYDKYYKNNDNNDNNDKDVTVDKLEREDKVDKVDKLYGDYDEIVNRQNNNDKNRDNKNREYDYRDDDRDNRDDRDEREDREDRDYRYDRDDRDDRDDRYYRDDKNMRNYRNDDYDPRKDNSIKNLDNYLYKKNIQILKIFKMKNRCVLLLVLMKELGKCILIYVDPSKYIIECQSNNSIVGRENVHDIELFRINHKHIYEVCDCYPELMNLSQTHRIDIDNEKNKIYLTHFEQICIQLNNYKKLVKSSKSKSKLGIITEYSINFINNDDEIELFTINEITPDKFSKMKTYLIYDLNIFMNNIEDIEFEVEKILPSLTDELNNDNKELRKHIENNSVLNNINSIKVILDKIENKKKGLIEDSNKLKNMFITANHNLKKAKSKRENVQQRFTVEKYDNTKQEIMYFKIDVDDEYNNLLSHTLNIMTLLDKQCKNINEYIEFIKKYCEIN